MNKVDKFLVRWLPLFFLAISFIYIFMSLFFLAVYKFFYNYYVILYGAFFSVLMGLCWLLINELLLDKIKKDKL